MSEIEEVQEQMKVDMEAMKDQMAAMMDAMLSMKKIMESNAAAIATMSAATEVNPTHPSGLNQVNPPVSDMVEYGQRWRDLAAQVSPPMMEREMITMIVDTLPVYYEKMVGYTPSSFADLVFPGKRIVVGLKRRKFDYPALMNGKPGENGENKKEGGTHVVIVVLT
ncbi:hypothetical protein HKD37_02G004656 [Glycine soja]